jgi:hypothetical protein
MVDATSRPRAQAAPTVAAHPAAVTVSALLGAFYQETRFECEITTNQTADCAPRGALLFGIVKRWVLHANRFFTQIGYAGFARPGIRCPLSALTYF